MGLSSMVFAFIAFNALVMAIAGLGFSIYAVIKVMAMEKSTHSVQFMPVDKAIDEENERFLAQMKEEVPSNPWGTSEDFLAKERELYNEDLEDMMPEFAIKKEDKEIHSY